MQTNSDVLKKDFFRIPINVMSREQVLNSCAHCLESNQSSTLFFLNAHCFNVAQLNKDYRNALEQTDVLLNDGVGLKIASWFCPYSFEENLNGTDLIPQIIDVCRQKDKSLFLLGAREGVAAKAAQKIKEKGQIRISGYHSGFFDAQQEKALIKSINDSQTDVLIVGFGVPKQELWVMQNKEQLNRVKLIIAGGAIIDFMSGEITRAPLLMRKLGLEWFYRLLLEPKRMWRRYVVGNFVFFYHIIRLKLFTAS